MNYLICSYANDANLSCFSFSASSLQVRKVVKSKSEYMVGWLLIKMFFRLNVTGLQKRAVPEVQNYTDSPSLLWQLWAGMYELHNSKNEMYVTGILSWKMWVCICTKTALWRCLSLRPAASLIDPQCLISLRQSWFFSCCQTKEPCLNGSSELSRVLSLSLSTSSPCTPTGAAASPAAYLSFYTSRTTVWVLSSSSLFLTSSTHCSH